MSWTIYVALAISTIAYLQPVSIFMCRLYKIIKPRRGGYQMVKWRLQEIGSRRPSVCPRRIGSQTTNAVGLNLVFYERHDPEQVLGEKNLKIS